MSPQQSNMWREPLTPTLSPQERGEGEEAPSRVTGFLWHSRFDADCT
jgi:hypothetical protein